MSVIQELNKACAKYHNKCIGERIAMDRILRPNPLLELYPPRELTRRERISVNIRYAIHKARWWLSNKILSRDEEEW